MRTTVNRGNLWVSDRDGSVYLKYHCSVASDYRCGLCQFYNASNDLAGYYDVAKKTGSAWRFICTANRCLNCKAIRWVSPERDNLYLDPRLKSTFTLEEL